MQYSILTYPKSNSVWLIPTRYVLNVSLGISGVIPLNLDSPTALPRNRS